MPGAASVTEPRLNPPVATGKSPGSGVANTTNPHFFEPFPAGCTHCVVSSTLTRAVTPQSALGRARTEVPYFRGEEKGRSRCSLRDHLLFAPGEALRTSEEGDLAARPLDGAGENMAVLRVPPRGAEQISWDSLGCRKRLRFLCLPMTVPKGKVRKAREEGGSSNE